MLDFSSRWSSCTANCSSSKAWPKIHQSPQSILATSCSAALPPQPPECVWSLKRYCTQFVTAKQQQHIYHPRQPLLMQGPVQIQHAWSQMTTTACCCACTAHRLAVQLHCNSCLMMHALRFRYSHLAPADTTIPHLVLLGLLYKDTLMVASIDYTFY